MSAKLYTLAAGERTPWIDLRPYIASPVTLQGTNTGGSVATLQTCNSAPTSATDTPDDTADLEAWNAASFFGRNPAPQSNFCRVENTGTGTLKFTFGPAVDHGGRGGDLTEVGFRMGTTGRSNEMPS